VDLAGNAVDFRSEEESSRKVIVQWLSFGDRGEELAGTLAFRDGALASRRCYRADSVGFHDIAGPLAALTLPPAPARAK
jgi:hypothetical protein